MSPVRIRYRVQKFSFKTLKRMRESGYYFVAFIGDKWEVAYYDAFMHWWSRVGHINKFTDIEFRSIDENKIIKFSDLSRKRK